MVRQNLKNCIGLPLCGPTACRDGDCGQVQFKPGSRIQARWPLASKISFREAESHPSGGGTGTSVEGGAAPQGEKTPEEELDTLFLELPRGRNAWQVRVIHK